MDKNGDPEKVWGVGLEKILKLACRRETFALTLERNLI